MPQKSLEVEITIKGVDKYAVKKFRAPEFNKYSCILLDTFLKIVLF